MPYSAPPPPPFPAGARWTDDQGKLTQEALQWLVKLIAWIKAGP